MKTDLQINKTHIENSYLITSNSLIEEEVMWVMERRNINKLPVTRKKNSYIREWRGHNRLYKWNIARSHTRDVVLDEYIGAKGKLKGIFNELIWLIIGGI